MGFEIVYETQVTIINHLRTYLLTYLSTHYKYKITYLLIHLLCKLIYGIVSDLTTVELRGYRFRCLHEKK